MKTLGKILSSCVLIAYLTTNSYAAYQTVTCDSDADFAANSCSQCFSGGEVVEWDNKGLLSDEWENIGDAAQVLFKEEQDMPSIVALGGAVWKEIKASDNVDFWEYTPALDALYDEEHLGYTLNKGEAVTWLESTLGSAYNLEKSSVAAGENVGMITYDIATHQVQSDGNIALDADTHRECVLFKSGTPGQPPVIPETPELPQTGPEHVLLALAALLLGFGFLKFRRKA